MFHTHFNLYKYLVMSFSLINTSAMFQTFMNKALDEFLNITCVVYLDDILIFSKKESKHEEHV